MPDLDPILLSVLPFAFKLLATAAIVVTATIVSERAGPFFGALFVTLPVTTWPAYVFLAFDHDPDFVAASALAGLVIVAANAAFMAVYVLLAQRFTMPVGFAGALLVWLLFGALARTTEWSFAAAVGLNMITFLFAIGLSRRYRHAAAPPLPRRRHDIALRVGVVCTFMGTVVLLGTWAGPAVTGFAAAFPASTASAILILHPRIGGPATAAVVANGILCHAGIAGLAAGLYLALVPLGPVAALAIALAIPLGWNVAIWAAHAGRLGPAASACRKSAPAN